jgi:hypothetical protein
MKSPQTCACNGQGLQGHRQLTILKIKFPYTGFAINNHVQLDIMCVCLYQFQNVHQTLTVVLKLIFLVCLYTDISLCITLIVLYSYFHFHKYELAIVGSHWSISTTKKFVNKIKIVYNSLRALKNFNKKYRWDL